MIEDCLQSRLEDAASHVRGLVADGVKLQDAIHDTSVQFAFKGHQIRDKYYAQGGSPTKTHGNRLLTREQEQTLRIMAVSFSASNIGWNKHMLAKAVLDTCGFVPSSRWCKAWIQSNKNWLSPRKSKHLSKKRSTDEMLEEVSSFCTAVEEARNTGNMTATTIVKRRENRHLPVHGRTCH